MGHNRVSFSLIIAALLFCVALVFFNGLYVGRVSETLVKPWVICIRVDDVQDFAFRDAQMRILEIGEDYEIPLSYSVISKYFSMDWELILSVSEAVRGGSEVTVHGWSHEELKNLGLEDQVQELLQAKKSIEKVLDVEVSVLVPPLFTYNEDTLRAMNVTGYDVLSSCTLYQSPGVGTTGVVNVPSTVDFSDYANGTWKVKSLNQLLVEVNQSVQENGYSVIVIHPQELMSGDMLDENTVKLFIDLIDGLSEKYSFCTIRDLVDVVN